MPQTFGPCCRTHSHFLTIPLVLIAGALALASAAFAATINVAPGAVAVANDGTCSLREAIDNANANTQVGNTDCAGGTAGLDTINLAAGSIYTLTDHDPSNTAVGLPQITTQIVINGNGATIERDSNLTCNPDGSLTVGQEFKIFWIPSGGDLTLNDLTLENGCADGNKGYMKDGGAIYMKSASLTVDRVTFMNNKAYNVSGALDTKNSTITITDSTFTGNTAGGGAGAIGNGTGSTMDITGSILSGNSAGATLGYGGGGAIGDYGELTITDSTISGNRDLSGANGIGGGGIGVINGGTLHITGSTISDNSSNGALGGGGGIGLAYSDATVTNCTIARNSASGDLGGGGILDLLSSLKLVFSTVVGNSATGKAGGGGVSVQALLGAAAFAAKSSIVADNTAGGDCTSSPGGVTFTSTGANFDSDGSCAAVDSTFSQHTSVALALGGLANNGGPTQTIALFPASAAIDAASDCNDLTGAPITTDQRGVLRPQDGNGDGTLACDLGAYELVPTVTAIPALSVTGLALLGLLLAGGALALLRRS